MATTNDQTQLVGDFIDVWGDNVVEAFKFAAPLAARIPFESGNLVGGKYHVPVDLAQEHGFTYAAANTTPTLLASVAGYMADGQVEGSQIYGRSLVAYEAIMRSQQQGKQAVREATKHVVKRLGRSGAKRLEVDLLHGRRGIGVIAAQSGASTTRTWTISDASWAPGIWAGMEGATLDVYRTNSTYADTKLNTTGAAGSLYVSAVDIENKQIDVTGNATDLTAIDSYSASNGFIFFETASTTTSMAGIDAISRNVGTLFNINAANYALWGGNVKSSTGVLSLAKILDALSLPASFGMMGMKATCIVSPKSFEVLNSDEAALRRHGAQYRSAGTNGFESLEFYSQTGALEILPHPFQKEGQAHIVALEEFHRIGASDLSFIDRGGGQPRLILESANSPSSEMRLQSHQAIYCEMPRHCVVLDGITYS